MLEMRTIAIDDPVAWCVSLSVCISRVCTLPKWLNGWMSYFGWRLLETQGTLY